MAIEPMVFDSLELITVPVKIAGKWYAIQEASEEAAARYQDELFKSTKISLDPSQPGGISVDSTQFSLEGISKVQALLVSLCLRECQYDEAKGVIISLGEPVSLDVVKSWPSRVVSPLFDTAKSISELDQRGMSAENFPKPGNGPNTTPAG